MGSQEILLVAFVIAVFYGVRRLPQIGDGLGRAVRNFNRSLRGDNEIDVTPKEISDSKNEEKEQA
ncbi:MAG: twin-arginine translocase TatA/TatE family subunit [Myxococcota bacterium]